MAQQLVLDKQGIENSSNELKTLSADILEMCNAMHGEISELKETEAFKTINASALYYETIDRLNGVVPKYTEDVLKFSEFLSNYVITNYQETDEEMKKQVESNLDESLAQLDNVKELGNGVNLDKISTSAQGALNGDFVKVNQDAFKDGELELKLRDDGTIQIMKNGTTLGFTTQNGATSGNISSSSSTAVQEPKQTENIDINPIAEASTVVGGGLAAATTAPSTSTQSSPTGANQFTSLGVPAVDSNFKAYEGYKVFNMENTRQYQMQHSDNCYTDQSGFRRYKEDGTDYYMVALGSHYTGGEIGKKYRITLDTGQQFYAVTGDQKADVHTDPTHMYRDNGVTTNVVEFIVDTSKISPDCKSAGSMSGANGGQFEGNVTDIELIG